MNHFLKLFIDQPALLNCYTKIIFKLLRFSENIPSYVLLRLKYHITNKKYFLPFPLLFPFLHLCNNSKQQNLTFKTYSNGCFKGI